MMNSSKKSSHGFSLLEILVVMVVVSVGLLGYASLQLNGISQTQAALFRSQAANSTHDMADRLRANPTGSFLGGYRTAETAKLAKPDCTLGCIPFDLAVSDLKNWQTILSQHLPLAAGVISCVDIDGADANPCSADSIHNIVVSWDDNKDGVANTSIQVEVRP